MTRPLGAAYPEQLVATSIDRRALVRHEFARRRLADLAGGPLPRLDTILALASGLHLRAGDLLIEQGKPFPYLVIVERGLLAQTVSREGREVTIAFLEREDVCGSLFALYGELARDSTAVGGTDAASISPYGVSVVSETRVVLLEPRHIANLASRHTEWATLRARLLLEHSLNQVARETERLTRSSEERYEDLVRRSPAAAAQLTQREIARYLGISEVTMSRLMARRAGRRAVAVTNGTKSRT